MMSSLHLIGMVTVLLFLFQPGIPAPISLNKMAGGVHSMSGKPDGMHTYSTRDIVIVIVVEEAPSHTKSRHLIRYMC